MPQCFKAMAETVISRGIRNNNPLNIRIGNNWWGEVDKPTDPQFEQFQKMEFGIRAAFIILRRYIEKYGRNTIRLIVESWAPSSENNTEAYVAFVSQKSGIDADTVIKYDDKPTMIKVVEAMIAMENGHSIGGAYVERGYDIAHR